MNVLILGSGGREHAFAWKLAQSPGLGDLYIAPGNAGTSDYGQNVDLDQLDFDAVSQFISANAVHLILVGPEVPLVQGISDYLELKHPNLHIIGPKSKGAMLEGSKAFAKAFMKKNGIPTANYAEFTNDTYAEGRAYIKNHPLPIVLKADGLAAGKGVIICNDRDHALLEFESMIGGKFGPAGNKVVIEAFLDGIEFSVFVMTDGSTYKVLPIAKDYKRIGEGDTGLNTGGMGSVSPVPFVTKDLFNKVENKIIKPTISGLKKEGIAYKGFIFFGLINVADNPMVIEYNCRMGDPETQSVLPRLKNDLLELCVSLATGDLDAIQIEEDQRTVASIVMVSGGYPGSYEKGKTIRGIDSTKEVIIFHAGTRQKGEEIETNGGRVLAVSSYGGDLALALRRSNKKAEEIVFDQSYYRKDIGFDL